MQGLLDHLQELVAFLADHRDVWDCSVVEIFNGPIKEIFPSEWMQALQASRTADLLQIPSGHIKDDWPPSLQSFIATAHRLSLKRNPTTALPLSSPDRPPFGRNLHMPNSDVNPVQSGDCTLQLTDLLKAPQNGPCSVSRFPPGPPPPGQNDKDPPKTVELDHVVAQGMSPKKRHEVAALAALVAKVALEAGATTVIDIGAGQGYLSNVLYYQYGLDVIAVDAAPGHAGVMQKRSGSISKYFRNLRRKARESKLATSRSIHPQHETDLSQREPAEGLGPSCETGVSGHGQFRGRRDNVRERWMTSAAEDELLDGPVVVTSKIDFGDAAAVLEKLRLELARIGDRNGRRGAERLLDGPVVLAGLHACGDLSASMLRTFAACPSVKVVVVVSCCYNLVTEAPTETPAGKALAPTERPKLNLRKSVPEPSGPFQNGPAGNSRRSPHCPQPGPTKELTNRSDCSENTSAGDLQEPFNSPKIGPSEIRQEPPDTLQPGLSGSEQSAPNLTENGQKPSIPPNTALSSLSPPRRSADPDARDGDSALESCSGCLSNPGNASCQISEPGGSSSGACSHQLYGFPLSAAVKAMGFRGLGINGRMLACQSAARWRAQSEEGFADVITKHTLRAAFQALLKKHFPAVWATKPVLGKQKKRPVGGVPCGNGTSVGGIANGNGSSVGGNPNGNGTSVGGNPNGNGSLVGGNPNGNGSPVGGLPSGNRRSLGRPPISGAPVVDNGSSVSNEETVGESEPKNDMRQNGACDRMSGSGSERQEARPDVKSDRCFKVSNDVLRGSRPSREASSSSTGEKRGQSDLKSLPSVPSSPGSLPNRANEACIGTAVGAEAELRNRRFPATSRVSDDERTSPESARERARFVEFATESLQQLGLPGVSENEIGDVWESLRSSKDLVGPFWTLRTAMAGPLESLLLLDRFLYLKECLEKTSASLPEDEQVCTGRLEKGEGSAAFRARVRMFPLFDPEISPRNVVIVGQKV